MNQYAVILLFSFASTSLASSQEALIVLTGDDPMDRMGQAVAGVGTTFFVGAEADEFSQFFADVGAVHSATWSRAGGLQLSVPLFGAEPGDRFGAALAAVRGQSQLLVGSPSANPPGRADAGRFDLVDATNGQLVTRWDGRAGLDAFGTSVCAVGDANGDGMPDYVGGAPASDYRS